MDWKSFLKLSKSKIVITFILFIIISYFLINLYANALKIIDVAMIGNHPVSKPINYAIWGFIPLSPLVILLSYLFTCLINYIFKKFQ